MNLTLYQEHVEKYKSCMDCDLHKKRQHVVFARGTVPCDVLLVGEAPGPSEDVIGKPFVGPAGHKMDGILARSIERVRPDLTYCLTNLICCIPLVEDGSKWTGPPYESVLACGGRLREFVEICDTPAGKLKLIVAVGNEARDWLDTKYRNRIKLHREIPVIDIVHPAAVIRANVANRGLMTQKAVVRLCEAVEDL